MNSVNQCAGCGEYKPDEDLTIGPPRICLNCFECASLHGMTEDGRGFDDIRREFRKLCKKGES